MPRLVTSAIASGAATGNALKVNQGAAQTLRFQMRQVE